MDYINGRYLDQDVPKPPVSLSGLTKNAQPMG
jgi:hypothetical protein